MTPLRASARDLARRLTLVGEPDARLLQLGFVLMLALDVVLRVLGGGEFRLVSWPTVGLALGVVAFLVSVSLAGSLVPPGAAFVVPLLDLAAIGLLRLTPEGSGAAILTVLPALWLGMLYGRRGAVVAGVATLLLVSLPGFVYVGLDGPSLSRLVLPVVVSVATAAGIAAALERSEAERDEARRRGLELGEALDTIEHQRRVSEAILDTVDVGLVLLDREGRYTAMNRRHRDFMTLAYPDGHAGRAGQIGVVYDADGTTLLSSEETPTHHASAGEEFDDRRIWVGDDPRTRRALSVSARTVRDDRGRFAGAALAYKDVTDFMRALQVKDEFVASVSHELRTPLTSILGYLQILMERDDLQPQVVEQLQVMERNAERLQRLVGDLLHTAQLDGGSTTLVRSEADLAEIVRHSLEAARRSAHASGILLTADVPAHLPMLLDAQRMGQVVDNLLSNAVKYTPSGGQVHLSLCLDGARAELTVIDTGIGIAAADRDRLFQRFFRARDAEQRSIQGIGLGLSITRSIVESHGGRIEVESTAGRGSIFRVRLPLDSEHLRSASA